jgi:hypothetical protein
MRSRNLAITTAVVVLGIGAWAAFRPELLFVNQSVNETGPTAATELAKGQFESYAHETVGTASLLNANGKTVLRLSGFTTSNGPDVHVLLTKTDDPKQIAGSLDLGSIKGNKGDQNYELPAGTKPGDYKAVNIWCKRFDVAFGGAVLKARVASRITTSPTNSGGFQLAAFSEEIRVTAGNFRGPGGRAELVESSSKRFLRVTGVRPSANQRVWLLKAENAQTPAEIKAAVKIDLGALKGGKGQFAVGKDIDAWLYRTAVVWDTKRNVAVGTAALRSDQEKQAFASSLEFA